MTFDDLKRVNEEINAKPWTSDPEMFNKAEWWERKDDGDCEDKSLVKLRKLIELGWPISAMRIGTCWVETGEYHAVLLVDFEGQTWALDNRQPTPTRFQELEELGYKFDRIQVAGTQEWKAYAASGPKAAPSL